MEDSREVVLRRLEAHYARTDEKTKDIPEQEMKRSCFEAIRSVRPHYEERH